MSNNIPYFILPVGLKAYIHNGVAASREDQWKDLGLNYVKLKNNLLGDDLDKGDLFGAKPYPTKEAGVHLHWTLPSALTHGILYKEELIFPAVPNRWLVLRVHNEQDKLEHKAWVVESDYTADAKRTGNWLSIDKEEGFGLKNIGKVTPYEDWTEPDEGRDSLTAIAPGNPAFSGYYKSCQNVFGFHDNLSGLDKGKNYSFTYLLVGWYSHAKQDPLNPQDKTDKKLWELQLENIKSRWEHPASWPEAGQETICHATLHEVLWSDNEDKKAPVIKTAVNTVLGNTAVEGLSARISRQTKADEKILSAFQYDLLKDIQTREEIDAQVHERGFAPIGGGTVWEIERTDETKKEEEDKLPPFPDIAFFKEMVLKKGEIDVKNEEVVEREASKQWADLKTLFYQLNKDQYDYDELIRRRNSLQLEFRAAWDRQLLAKVAADKIPENKDIKGIMTEIESLTGDIGKLLKKVGSDHNDGYRFGSSQNIIHELLGYTQNPQKDANGNIVLNDRGKYRLARKKMPNFWRSKDPALLFSGPGIDKADKYRFEEPGGKLKGRMKEGLIDKVQLQAKNMSAAWTSLIDAKLPEFPLAIKPDMPLDVVEMLYFEMLLLDNISAATIAKAYFVQNGRKDDPNYANLIPVIKWFLNPKRSLDDKELQGNQLLGFQSADGGSISSEEILGIGRQKYFASIGQNTWQPPWTPIHMLWEVEWYPDYVKESESWKFDFSNWEWNNVQYRWKTGMQVNSKKIVYKGKTLLSSAAEDLLKNKLQGFDKLDQINLLSQALDGLTDCLLMQKQAIRLPLLEKKENKIVQVKKMDQFESSSHYFLPMTNSLSGAAFNFFPLRAGHMKIRQLWIVDTFGQIQYVAKKEDEETTFSGSLFAAKDNQSKADDLFILPPRLCQAARLMFRWKSARHEDLDSNSDPASSPVFGWILYHRIDNSMWVYDQEGNALGALFYVDGDDVFAWRSAPVKASGMKARSMEDEVQDPELLRFLQGLQASRNTWSYLKKTLEDLDISLGEKGQQYNNSLAHQISQPLALVRASVWLESFGLPAYPQSQNVSWEKQSQMEARGLKNVKFKLSIGNRMSKKDGLVGYFINRDFKQINLAHGFENPSNEYFGLETVQLELNNPAVDLTLLIDPRGGVTARTGILPEKYIDLPQEYIQEPLEHMELFFQTTPVLSALNELNLPIKQQSRKWSWFFLDETGKWGHKEASPGSANNDFKQLSLQEGFLKLEKEGVTIQDPEEEK